MYTCLKTRSTFIVQMDKGEDLETAVKRVRDRFKNPWN
jgi:hypothetical protein